MSEMELRRQSRYTWMLIAFTAIFVVLMARPSRAALLNWDGDNAAGNFSYNNNWYSDAQPGWGFGNQLQFNYRNNAGQTSLYWDYGTGSTWYNVDNITFMNTWATAITWNGNGGGINFNDKIENQSSYTITFGTMNFSGGKNGATAIELNPVNGDMVFSGGNLYNDNSLGYKVFGANSKMLTLGTTLGIGTNAAKVGLNIEQYSKVYITAAQSYQSNTAIKTGELWIGTGGSIHANSKIDLGLSDTATAKFYLTGTGTDSHNINVLNNGGIKVIGTLGTGGATNTFSGNITNNSTSGGVLLENTTNGVANFTGVISGTGSVQIGGGATGSTNATVILAGANTFTGPLYLSAGVLSITNGNNLGQGGIQFGNAGTLLSLLVNSNVTITNQFRINNTATNGSINVASGTTTTITGQLTQDSTKVNTTKFGKDGAGTLVFSNTSSDFNGQIQIGNGSVVLGVNNALGTNTSTTARGVDLGLNVGDVSMTNNVSLLASNGVTVGQSIYIAPSVNGGVTNTRTIGLSGNGTNSYTNQFYLDGTLTVAVGSASSDRVNLTGNITNTGGLIKTGSGFLNLSASNSYTGGTTLALGSTEGILIGHDNAFGTGNVTNLAANAIFQSDTTRTVANNFRLDANTVFTGSGSLTINGTLSISASPDLTNNLTGGLTLNNLTLGSSGTSRTLSLRGTGTTTINGVIANAASQTTNNFVIGSGGGTNSLTILNGNNTYTGATTINSGATVRLGHINGLGSTNAGTSISTLGGALDLNGLTGVAESFTGGGSGVSSSGMFFNSSASAASLTGTVTLTANTTVGVTNGAITLSGAISESGGVRSLTKTGTGTLTLSGANTYSGGFVFSAGTVVIGNDAALGTGAADFTSNVILNSDGSARTITNAITFRNLTVGGTGALTLSGTNTHTASSNTLTNNNSGGLTLGALNLSGTATGRTMTVVGTGNTIFAGTIANGPSATTGGLTFNSSGTTTLSGSNSYSGDTTITTGTVILSGTNSGSGSVVLVANTSVFKIGRTDSLVNGNLVGASSSANTGTVDLTGGGNYSIASLGNSAANSGNIIFTNSSGSATTLTFTAATNIISSGSNGARTVANNSSNLNLVFNGLVDIGGTGSTNGVTFDGAGNYTFNGAITNSSGTRNLVKSGAGTLTMNAVSGYSGWTLINGGTLATGVNEVILDSSTVSISSGATFRLGGNETVAQANSTSSTSTIDLQGNTLTIGGTGLSYTNSALTTGTGGKVVKNGAGLLFLDNGANTYTGGFTLNSGEVQFSTSGSAGSGVLSNSVFGTGTLTLAGGTIASSSTAGTSGRTIYNSVVLNGTVQMGQTGWGSTNANMNGGTSLLSFSTNGSGSTILQGDSTINTLGYVQWDQAISGNYRLTKTGTGANNLSNNYLRLTSSNNIAGVTVSSGIVGYKNRNSFGNGTLILGDGVAVGQDGLINNANLTGNDQTDRAVVNNIQLNGNVTFGLGGTANHLGGAMDLNGATRTITLGNTTYQYGTVTNGGLVIDNGTAASSRMFGLYASNSYSGGTAVLTNAILAVGNDNALGSGALTFTNSTGSGNATLRASTLSTNASQSRTIANDIVLANGMNVTVDTVSSAQDSAGASVAVALNTTLAGNISGSGSLTKTNSNTLTLSGSNSYTGGTTISAGTLVGTTGSLQGAITNNSALKFDQTSTGTSSASISGSGSFEKRGVGEVTLSGANTYTGGTTISAGTLVGTTGSLQGAITNNSAVKFDQTSDGTYAGVISGSGSFEKKGVGEVTLNNANTYSGGTTITQGTLKLNRAGNGTGGTIVGTIAISGGTLLLGQANQISDSSAINLGGGTISTGGFADRVGALTISGDSAISGLVAAGTAGGAGASDFLFSSIDLNTYAGGGGSTLNLGGGYSYGQTINISSSNYTAWSGYSSGNLNTFADKVMFGSTGMKAQISFNSTTGLTYVTAIPEPKVYVAAGILCALVGLTEYRRRKQRAANAV